MSLSVKKSEADPRAIELYWEGEKWRSVRRSIFIQAIKPLRDMACKEEFEAAFRLVEMKVAKVEMGNLLARKGYLARELRAKLMDKGISKEAAENAIAFGREHGMIDDAAEWERFVTSQMRKGLGPRAILFALKQKRIDPATLSHFERSLFAQEQELLQAFMRKKGSQIDWTQKQKAMNMLYRKGFTSAAIQAFFCK